MTYPALVGSRKQSVQDAERLFSSSLLKFMERKDYEYESQYIRAIRGWRQACDQRGLPELERCRHNYNLLNFILEELMPWYTQSYDFSLLEVNRFVLNTVLKFCTITYMYTPYTWYNHIHVVKSMLPYPFRDGKCMYYTPPPQTNQCNSEYDLSYLIQRCLLLILQL